MMLVDTNVLSELPRRRPNADVLRWFATLSSVHVSVVSIEELAFGVARAAAPARLRLARWLDGLFEARPIVLEVNLPIARACAELRAAREARGRRVAQADMLIAATALTHGLTLASRNVRDFDGCGISVFDPFTPRT